MKGRDSGRFTGWTDRKAVMIRPPIRRPMLSFCASSAFRAAVFLKTKVYFLIIIIIFFLGSKNINTRNAIQPGSLSQTQTKYYKETEREYKNKIKKETLLNRFHRYPNLFLKKNKN